MNQTIGFRRRRRPRSTMTDRQFIEWMRDQCDLQLGTTPPGPDPDTDSPTGRQPRLCWSSALQRIYNRMYDELTSGDDTLGAQWCDLIFDNARGDRYGDSGLWATLAYQITGDLSWVEEAWRKVSTWTQPDGNGRRESGQERTLIIEWLWPGLSEDRRAYGLDYLTTLWTACDPAAARLNDSDQTTGDYFGLAWFALAFGDIHPPAQSLFDRPRVGGLDATSVDLTTTMRNAIAWFVEAAKGGEWIESGEYNMGTLRLIAHGALGVQTATGVDHFPEVTAWLPTAGLRCPSMATDDLEQCVQWGDEQHPHQLEGWRWSSTAMCFDHPASRKVVYDLVAKLGARGSYSAEPTVARAFLLFDPYGPQAPAPSPLWHASGQGMTTMRSPQGSQLWTHLPPTPWASAVDHLVGYYGDLQLYRRDQGWRLTHPIMYGGYGNNGMAINSMLHRGIGVPRECRLSNAVYTGEDWCFVAGTAGGTILASKFYQPPPTFWHEHSRSILWIFGDVDTLIIFDRSHLDDPLTLPNCAKYPDDMEKKFRENALRQWRWHAPVPPTISGRSASWATDSGETARVTWLRDDLTPSIHDQTVEWASLSCVASEKKFHLQLDAVDCPGFDAFVTVLEFGDPAQFSTIALHRDPEQEALAVLLTRSGRPDWAVLLNTTPGPTLPTYGGQSAYHPEIPGLLANVRVRDYPIPSGTGARVWGMETASGLPTLDPS